MFRDREEAGKLLAKEVEKVVQDRENTVLLAIPRGGVPVAYQIAKELKIPFSMIVSKKITFPHEPEAAIGAAAPDGSYILSNYITDSSFQVKEAIKKAVEEAKEKLKKYLKGKEPDLKGKDVIIVDDGIATGYTAAVAGMYAKKKGAKRVILAVPVCPSDINSKIYEIFDDFVCFHRAKDIFFAVGAYYQDFHQVSDEELNFYLKEAEKNNLIYKGG